MPSPLHRDADGCRETILDYRARIRALGTALRDCREVGESHPAQALLDELRLGLERDVCARSTLEAQGLMTGVETRVLEPALRQARIALTFPARAPAAEWQTHLQAADACFLVALGQLNGRPGWTSLRVRGGRTRDGASAWRAGPGPRGSRDP